MCVCVVTSVVNAVTVAAADVVAQPKPNQLGATQRHTVRQTKHAYRRRNGECAVFSMHSPLMQIATSVTLARELCLCAIRVRADSAIK